MAGAAATTSCCPRRAPSEPELVLVSAGFDAHAEDPLANCRLQTGSFAAMARLVRDRARAWGSRSVSCSRAATTRACWPSASARRCPRWPGRARRSGLRRAARRAEPGSLAAAGAGAAGCPQHSGAGAQPKNSSAVSYSAGSSSFGSRRASRERHLDDVGAAQRHHRSRSARPRRRPSQPRRSASRARGRRRRGCRRAARGRGS